MTTGALGTLLPEVQAVGVINPPRTGRSRIICGDDERQYVVRCRNVEYFPDTVPFPAREAFSWLLCQHLGLSTPSAARIDPGRIVGGGALPHNYQDRHSALFGCELPPHSSSFDYIPKSLRNDICNHSEMLTWWVFDFWVANTQPTQAVYVKARDGGIYGLKINHMGCVGPKALRQLTSESRFDTHHPSATPSETEEVAMLIAAIKALVFPVGRIEDLAETISKEFGGTTTLLRIARSLRGRALELSLWGVEMTMRMSKASDRRIAFAQTFCAVTERVSCCVS